MLKNIKTSWASIILLLSLILCGCNTFGEMAIVHDELFTYEEPIDKTYLKVVDAVDKTPGWKLAGTDKNAGKIIASATDFMCDDSVTILIKRIGRRKTAVELAPESREIRNVEAILKQIDKELLE